VHFVTDNQLILKKIMKILVINTGSSSLKYDLFDMTRETVIFRGEMDQIGLAQATHLTEAGRSRETEKQVELPDHGAAVDEMLATLNETALSSQAELAGVAHRVLHGGRYQNATLINGEVLAELRRMIPFVHLHHPVMIAEIEACQSRLPEARHVAVFDNFFHHTIPEEAAVYGLPYRYFAENGYRRTGYHGFSHAYVASKAAEFVGRPLVELKIISCHLGNGASVCAIKGGRSIDTSMGMTPQEGLLMGTRCGDVDPVLLPVIMQKESLSAERMIDLLCEESGLLGLSGVSRNMHEIEAAGRQGNPKAQLAFKAFCYRVRRYIGAMLMVLGGCNGLIFTGGIGEHSAEVRAGVLAGTAELGFVLDQTKNSQPQGPTEEERVLDITAPASRVRLLAIKTFEELIMARQCREVVAGL
jgi:acetate kinase